MEANRFPIHWLSILPKNGKFSLYSTPIPISVYTRPQSEILAEHQRYIDTALDYCDLTDNMPDEAKFRWTCESAWVVKEYLKTRPAAQVKAVQKTNRRRPHRSDGDVLQHGRNFRREPDDRFSPTVAGPSGMQVFLSKQPCKTTSTVSPGACPIISKIRESGS